MANPDFGITINELDDEPRPIVEANLSTIGAVLTAPDADVTAWPVNTPIRLNSTDNAMVELLGMTGTARAQIDLINANLNGLSADMVIVLATPGIDDAATALALSDALDLLVASPAATGVTPGLLIAPGYTFQQDTPQTANALIPDLIAAAERLEAHAIVSGPHSTRQAFTDWRETFSSRRAIPVESWVKVADGSIIDSVGGVAAMLVARDAANRGRPFKSAANRPMGGIVAVNRPIAFSLVDGATEGQLILAEDGAIIVKGERGTRGAIADGGFVFVGYATASDDDLWRYYNQTRGRDWINITARQTTAFYLGRYNLTPRTVDLILQSLDGLLTGLEADQDILGFRVSFDPDKNQPGDLRLGKLRVSFRAEEPAVLRHLTIDSGRYIEALTESFGAIAAA